MYDNDNNPYLNNKRMHYTPTTFEIPLTSLSKMAVRLENLLTDLAFATEDSSPVIHKYALIRCFELMKILNKPELKSRFLKELLRIDHLLKKSIVQIPSDLNETLVESIQILSHGMPSLDQSLCKDPFIQALQSNSFISLLEIDDSCLELQLWLTSSAESRKTYLKKWYESMAGLRQVITTYLNVLR
jgi:cell division protein ZapD